MAKWETAIVNMTKGLILLLYLYKIWELHLLPPPQSYKLENHCSEYEKNRVVSYNTHTKLTKHDDK
jgi:hypothetical protein